MQHESLQLVNQIIKNDCPYFILYNTNQRCYFSVIQNNDNIQIPTELQNLQKNESIPLSVIPLLEYSSLDPSVFAKDQNEGNQYSLISLFDLFTPSTSTSSSKISFDINKNNKFELKFTPGEYAKAIYGISQAFCFAAKHNLSISLFDVFFDNEKLPHVAFCTPLIQESQGAKVLNNNSDNYTYNSNDTKIALGHILYLLALLTFEDMTNKEDENDDNFFFNDDDDDKAVLETEDGENVEVGTEIEEIKETDENGNIQNQEVIIKQEEEYVNLDENNHSDADDDNHNLDNNENPNEEAVNNEELNRNENKAVLFNRQKVFQIFRSTHNIISPPFELFPSFIDELVDRCMCPTVPFEWIIDQISKNIEFIIDHGQDAEKSIDDPNTQTMVRSFRQYEHGFQLFSPNKSDTNGDVDENIDDNDIPLRPPTAAPGTFRSFVIQEDLPYKMDPWIYCQTQSIIDLQAILMDTTEETLEENISIFLDSIYRHDMQLIDSFVHYIIIAVFHRPKCIRTISLLVKGIIDACLNESKSNDQNAITDGEEYVKRLKEAIVRMTPEKPASSGHYANACGPLNFIYECHKIGIFNDEEICQLIRGLTSSKNKSKDDPSQYEASKFDVRRVGAHLAAYFAPLLDTIDPQLLQAITNQVIMYRSEYPKVFFNTFNVIFDIITQEEQEKAILNQSNQEMSKENWDILEKMIYNRNGIREVLQRDDIEQLREMAANPNFDMNMRINPSLFDPYIMAADKPTILEYSAFHSAIKCFRYLLLNGADTKLKDTLDRTIVHYAIAGGSIEIVRICEQEQLNFDGALEESVKMYQFDIFEWLQGTKYPVLPMNNLTYGSIPVNAARTNNIRMILFSLENGLDINVSDQHDSFPLFLACLFGYNDVIRLLLTSPNIEVNKQDRQGNTSLIIAIDEGYTDTVKLLLSHRDIDMTIPNNNGLTAIHYAANQGKVDIVRIMLEKAQTMFSDGAMHLALLSANDNYNIFHYSLIRYGLTVDVIKPKKPEENNENNENDENNNDDDENSQQIVVKDNQDSLKYKEIFNILVSYLLLNKEVISNDNDNNNSNDNNDNDNIDINNNDNNNDGSEVLSEDDKFVNQQLRSILNNRGFIKYVQSRKLNMPERVAKIVDELVNERTEEEMRPADIFRNNPDMIRQILPQMMQAAGQNPQMMAFINQLMMNYLGRNAVEEEEEEEWEDNHDDQNDQQDEN